MKFTAVSIAFFVAAVMAAPAAEPDAVAAPVAGLDERAEWCTDCENGKHTCCSALGCYPPSHC